MESSSCGRPFSSRPSSTYLTCILYIVSLSDQNHHPLPHSPNEVVFVTGPSIWPSPRRWLATAAVRYFRSQPSPGIMLYKRFGPSIMQIDNPFICALYPLRPFRPPPPPLPDQSNGYRWVQMSQQSSFRKKTAATTNGQNRCIVNKKCKLSFIDCQESILSSLSPNDDDFPAPDESVRKITRKVSSLLPFNYYRCSWSHDKREPKVLCRGSSSVTIRYILLIELSPGEPIAIGKFIINRLLNGDCVFICNISNPFKGPNPSWKKRPWENRKSLFAMQNTVSSIHPLCMCVQ